MKKLLSIALAVSTIAWAGAAYVPVANAAVVDGDIVSATAAFVDADGNTYQAYDVFIIKIVGSKTFKRLVLNPQVFTSYGHLKWSNLKKLSATEVAGYTTSALVRVINDEKVYKLAPDGDSGTKQWVDDLACFNTKGYDWDSVYIINAVDGGNYTTGGSICGTSVTGAMTLSLASDNPASATVPLHAYGVTYMKFDISGSGTISQLVIHRNGSGDSSKFTSVYLYENGKRLGSGRSISTSTNKATFIGLSIVAPTTISIVADVDYTGAGYQDYFSIDSASEVTANATVGGSFPIKGNYLSSSAATAGTLVVATNGSTAYNVTVGAQEAEVSAFKVTTATEASKISRIQLYQGGTITPSKITDLKLKADGVTIATATTVGDDGYVVFNLATPKEITKGSSEIFYVYADVSGKPTETVKLYLDEATDILGIGQTYGFGMKATITAYASGTCVTATLVGGDLTLVKDTSVVAGKIGLDTSDTVFLALTMTAAADITINRTRLAWCHDAAGAGADYETLVATSPYFADVEDVKIVNKDTGAVIAGPHDGSAFITVTSATVGGLCPQDAPGLYKDFTDNFDLSAGESINLQVTADVVDGNTAETQSSLVTGSVIKLIWVSYGTVVGTTGTISYMKYTGTNNAVLAANIVPSSDIAGEEMTLAAPALAITLAGTPAGDAGTQVTTHAVGTARTYVTGQTAVPVNGFILTAGSASDIKITALTLDGYVNCNDAATEFDNGLQDTNCYTKNLVSSVEIWDTTLNTMVPGSSAKGFTGTSYVDVAYTGLNWTIPAGESRTLLVKANLSSIIPSDSTNFDAIAFDIVAPATDVVAQDKDGTTVVVTGDSVNLSTNDPSVSIAIYSYGSIAVAAANDTPDQNVLLMGSTNNEVSKYKLTASREAFNVDTFSVGLLDDSGEVELADRTNLTGVALKYQTAAQYGTSDWTVSSKKQFGATATLSFTFSGTARPYVPKDDSSYITALVDVDSYSAGTGAHSGDYFNMMVATGTDEIKLYGAQSGHLLNSATQLTTGFNEQYIFRSKPFFEKVAWSGDNLELAKFSITATGYDVTFDGTDATNLGSNYTFSDTGTTSRLVSDSVVSSAIEFDVIASGTDNTVQTIYLYDWNNAIISSVSGVTLSHADAVTESMASTDDNAATTCSVLDTSTLEACITSISFRFEAASNATVIPKDVTKTFYVMLDNANDFNNQDEYIYLKLNQTEGGATGYANLDNCSIVWYDSTDDEGGAETFEHRICMPANTKNIGAFPITFRQLVGTSSE